jgi:hypothetical protein
MPGRSLENASELQPDGIGHEDLKEQRATDRDIPKTDKRIGAPSETRQAPQGENPGEIRQHRAL